MRSLGVSVLIGAALAPGYRSAIGKALGGLGELDKGLGGLQLRLLDVGQAWAGMHVLGKLVGSAGDLEHQLMEIGITADMSGQDIEQLRQHLRALSVPGETNQSVEKLAGAYGALVSAGLDNDKADAALRSIGRAATAASADIEDMSKMSFTLIDTLGVAPDALSGELDRLAFAGKKGAFELKDMARYFPVLGAGAKDMGLKGTQAVVAMGAALQIAKKGAGDASEAATNMANFMQKALAPQTLKNFSEHGVDLMKVYSGALKEGADPIEAIVSKIDSMLGPDADKRKQRLGMLFQDMQVQNFLRPMLQNLDEYRSLKKEIGAAAGTVDTD